MSENKTSTFKAERTKIADIDYPTGGSLLRSALFSLVFMVSLAIISIATLLVTPFPYIVRYHVASSWSRLNIFALKLICKIDYEFVGLENLPEQPSIVFCKHQSMWETMALAMFLPSQCWVLKRELLWTPFFGWAMAALRPISIDRTAGRKALKQVLQQGKQRLKDGIWITIYPEGTRIRPGERKKYGIGGAMLAEKTRAPVVPIAHNAGLFWAKRQFIKNPGKITLTIGKPIETKDLKAQQINDLAEEWIESESLRLIEPYLASKTSEAKD